MAKLRSVFSLAWAQSAEPSESTPHTQCRSEGLRHWDSHQQGW